MIDWTKLVMQRTDFDRFDYIRDLLGYKIVERTRKPQLVPAEILEPIVKSTFADILYGIRRDESIIQVTYRTKGRNKEENWQRFEREELLSRSVLEDIAENAERSGALWVHFNEVGKAPDHIEFREHENNVVSVIVTTWPQEYRRFTWYGEAPNQRRIIGALNTTSTFPQPDQSQHPHPDQSQQLSSFPAQQPSYPHQK